MKAALKRGVETGALVQVKASYKLSADAKKKKKEPAAKKPAGTATKKKASTVKKAAPKKKVRTVVE
jgi:histone H1/5